jgi:exonuclease SbcC
MRPTRLEIKGFTAFRDPQEIDFTDLDLFALWGPMGSGKSSVLDALTYALYGKIERVGSSTSQLVSQGQPRMSVLLEFEVADQRYRVSRSTPAKGSAKVRLERHDGSEWRTFGEGADRAREVNKTLTDLIGLDYPAFTRAVLLPQGKFAEFLTGDASERRKILTELLGLELFGRMAGIARRTADEAKADAGARLSLIDQYSGIDTSVLEKARAEAEAETKLAATATKIKKELTTLGREGETLEREIASLEECMIETSDLATRLTEEAERLIELAATIEESSAKVAAATRAEAESKKNLERAVAALEKTEKSGSLEKLIETKGAIATLARSREELSVTESAITEAAAALAEARKQESTASKDAAAATEAAEAATSSVADREHAMAHAQRSDLVGTLTHAAKIGDPCPVCEKPLDSIPKSDTKALKKAEKALVDARSAAKQAIDAKGKAETSAGLASARVKNAEEQLTRCETERLRRANEVTETEAKVAATFSGSVPADAGAKIETSIEKLKELVAERDAASKAHAEATKTLRSIEKESDVSRSALDRVRGTLRATPIEACVKRALKVDPKLKAVAALPDPLPEDVREVSEVTTAAADSLRSLVTEIDDRRSARSDDASKLVGKALAKMSPVLSEDVVIPRSGLTEVLGAFEAIADDLQKTAIRAGEAVTSIERDLEKKAALEKEVAEKRAIEANYRALAKELSGNHIVDYLQSEALAALAAAGSDRLSYLSADRYRLAYEDDEFFVVDGWNGEETRSVKTLSGGETFLASLALALALSDEVRNLAVTDKAPIESLFLDEGFGSLDAETLDTVVSAIEQLGGDGRMVGVITHVADVADRLPVKLVVTKSPRGSRIDREVRAGLQLLA